MILNKEIEIAFKKYRERDLSHHVNDIIFIKDVIRKRYNIELEHLNAFDFWKWYSEDMYCASWLKPTQDDVETGFIKFLSHIGVEI
jgi:hypothetical protein